MRFTLWRKMIGIESIKYSLNNLKKRKVRSFLTTVSIFIGIATIFIFISFGLGLYTYVNDFVSGSSADKVIVQAVGLTAPGLDSTFKLEEKDLRAVEKTPGVFEATGVYIKIAEVELKNQKKFVFLSAYDPKKPILIEISNTEIIEGRQLSSGDEGNVVLGYNYLLDNKVFSKGLSVGEEIKVQGKNLKIIGFYESVGNPQDDSNVYIIDDAIDKIYNESENSFGWIVARVDPDEIDKTTENIERSLRKVRDIEEGKEDFFVQSFSDLVESYASALNIIIGFVILIAFISVLVSAINTANTMITSVLERIKEIGILKSIGARNSEIFGIFLFESSFLGFIAGVIGVLIGYLLAYFGGIILDDLGWGFLSPTFPISLFIGCVLFAVITGAVSGVIPAIRASRINTVDALRYE